MYRRRGNIKTRFPRHQCFFKIFLLYNLNTSFNRYFACIFPSFAALSKAKAITWEAFVNTCYLSIGMVYLFSLVISAATSNEITAHCRITSNVVETSDVVSNVWTHNMLWWKFFSCIFCLYFYRPHDLHFVSMSFIWISLHLISVNICSVSLYIPKYSMKS